MNQIKCPKCGEVFQIDESAYMAIVNQIRDKEFNKRILEKEEQYKVDKENALKTTKLEIEKNYEKELSSKDIEIQQLKSQIATNKTEMELAVNKAVLDKDKEIADKAQEIISLKGQLKNDEKDYQLREKNIKENYEGQLKLKDEQIAQYKDFKARQSVKLLGETLEQHCGACRKQQPRLVPRTQKRKQRSRRASPYIKLYINFFAMSSTIFSGRKTL